MMKILYLDFMYYTGHIRSNKNFIKALSRFSTVYALTQTNYFDEYDSELADIKSVKLIKKDNLYLSKGQLLNRISSIKIMLVSAIQAKKIKPDYIFVASFDTIAFKFGRFLFGKTENMYLLHTINIDELSNNIKKKIFNMYKNKVKHIVFEQYMKEHLIANIGIDPGRVFVIPHPLNDNTQTKTKEIEYKCVGLSNSNNEEFIANIIKHEQKEQIFKKNSKRVVLKSKEKEFDNGYLKVIKGFLDKNIYDEYINNAECILIPFPENFTYRMSGTLIDAFSNNKIVLGNNIPIINEYARRYPNICKIFENEAEMINKICFMKSEENLENKFNEFKNKHSIEELEKSFKYMFK